MSHWRTIVIVIAAQAALVGGWLLIESRRSDAPPVAQVRTTALNEPAPPLTLIRPNRLQRPPTPTALHQMKGPIVLHFWATWCPPCRDELPGLLAFAGSADARVLAVSLDEDWAVIRGLLGPDLPPSVMRADVGGAQAFGVERLPVTFVIDADRRIRLRMDGARDWSMPAPAARIRKALARPYAPSP